MNFGQLIEYNLINIFLEESSIKCGGELFPDLSWKMKIEHISGLILQSFIYFLVVVCQAEDYQNWLKLSWRDYLHLPQIKLFWKTKGGLELVSLPYFLHDFEEK